MFKLSLISGRIVVVGSMVWFSGVDLRKN